MEIWLKDEQTGIEYGKNDYDELFLGDNNSGYNLPDTPENRSQMMHDFYRYTNQPKNQA